MGNIEVGKTYKTVAGWDAVVVGQRPDGMFIGYYTMPKTSHTQTCTWDLAGDLYAPLYGKMPHASGSLVIPESKKTYIPWGRVGDEYNFYTRDDDGKGFFFHLKPEYEGGFWYSGGACSYADLLRDIIEGDEAPEDSLIVRPGYEE